MSRGVYAGLFERLIANSEKPDDQNENGCWLWVGNTTRQGYGRVTRRVANRSCPVKVMAHRAMEQQMRDNAAQFAADDTVPGDWWAPLPTSARAEPLHPDEETIEHLCWTPGCINPDHWTTLTRAENTAAMQRARKWVSSIMSAARQAVPESLPATYQHG